jgi:2-haloacid dehalogenase
MTCRSNGIISHRRAIFLLPYEPAFDERAAQSVGRFSADGVKHHKPSPQAYGYVEKALGVTPSQLCMIACHTWDTLGAVAAGWQAALIKRVGNDVLGVGPQPHIVGNDLNDVADQLIARHKRAA